MNKFFKMLGLIVLLSFSFIYTEKTVMVVKEYDQIMIKIKEKASLYKSEKVDALVYKNTIIPGIKKETIDINKSYKEMKQYGSYDERLIVYKKHRLNTSIDSNLDKYIISGNKNKNMISLIFLVENNDNINKIFEILNKYNIKGTFFINSNYLEKNNTKILNLIKNNHTIGNLSYKRDYTNSNFSWIDTVIRKVFKQKKGYCFMEKEKEKDIKICSDNTNYTIKANVINKNQYIETKKLISSGTLLVYEINKELENELSLIINFINSKGYLIKNLEEHLSE